MVRHRFSPLRSLAGAIAAAALVAGCGDVIQPTPARHLAFRGESPALNAGFNGSVVTVCKMTGIQDVQYAFTATAVGGTGWYMPDMPRLLIASEIPISDESCKDFWLGEDPSSAPTQVTITEAGYMPDSIIVDPYGAHVKLTGTATAIVNVDYENGSLIKYYNPRGTLTPPTGAYGCTPGYWKQWQHLGSWTGYATADLYDATFGVTLLGSGVTLLEALKLGGGGAHRLARHSTAALLNATALAGDFAFTPTGVIDAVQDAVASGDFDAASDVLEHENKKRCPLGRAIQDP